jgi:hypothetical protein
MDQIAPQPSAGIPAIQSTTTNEMPFSMPDPMISPEEPFVYPELGNFGDGEGVDINSWVNMIPDNLDLGWLLPAGLGDLNADEGS